MGGGTSLGPVWCLNVTLTIKEDMVDQFLVKFAEIARHVEANEPETFSYEIGRGDQEETKNTFIIVERYSEKEKLRDPHQTSESFKKFKEWMEKSGCVVSKSGFSFNELGIGYVQR